VDAIVFATKLLKALQGLAQMLDFYSDILVIYLIWLWSQKDENRHKPGYKYSVLISLVAAAST
jgi:hypothetical protein